MSHEYTVERLYHFTCEECKNWWSYATVHFPLRVKTQKQARLWPHKNLGLHSMTCPHCGTKSTIMSKEQ